MKRQDRNCYFDDSCLKLNVVDKTPISSSFLVELYVGPTHGCIFKTSIDLIFVLFPDKTSHD